MKKYLVYSMIFCAALLVGCDKNDPNDGPFGQTEKIPLLNGAILINSSPDVNIDAKNEFPVGSQTSHAASGSMVKSSVGGEQPAEQLRANDYRFKLVAHMGTLSLERDGTLYRAQASHVKILDNGSSGYAFVSYNHQHEPNIGGLVVYRYTITGEQSLETVSVNVTAVTSIEMPDAQINAIDFDGRKLYIAGATDNPLALGFNYREDPAFFMVMELDANMNFKPVDPQAVKQLTSFQATSIRYFNGRVYITTGDGTNGTIGGLHIYDATDYSYVRSIRDLEHARSVDINESGIYLMQANHARVTRFNLDGSSPNVIYNEPNRAMQRDAKSEILVWNDYIFVSENESGLTMLTKNGQAHRRLAPPNWGQAGWCDERDVTNSVSMNSDTKVAFDHRGARRNINSNLLLLANGRQGLHWYDIMEDSKGDSWIVANSTNSILAGTGSANFVESSGNIVFVADGLGGLKVLYIGFNVGRPPPPVNPYGCVFFMTFLYDGTSNLNMLFPEEMNVFRPDAHEIVRTLFQLPSRAEAAKSVLNYIKITEDTQLFVTYVAEGAGWNNALGFFVIPASVPNNDEAEFQYYIQNIRPNLHTNYVLREEHIIFRHIRDIAGNPNIGTTPGHLTRGEVFEIDGGRTFKKGERVVLFMCPDGFIPQNDHVMVTFNPGNNGNVNQIFFMHRHFNLQTGIRYANAYGDFRGVQMMSFLSSDCGSMVVCIEDIHTQHVHLDTDFNDIIISISDNKDNYQVSRFELPKWTVGIIDGKLDIILTEDFLKR